MHYVKHAFRQLALHPGLSLVVIGMLALGIGATTAVFPLFHEVLARPLSAPAPERLVNLGAPGPKPGGAIGLGRAAEALLFGLSGYDPLVLVAASGVLAAVVIGAGYVPARRASSIAPMEALRHE